MKLNELGRQTLVRKADLMKTEFLSAEPHLILPCSDLLQA